MSYHSQRLGANGDAIAERPEAAAGQPSRPTSTDRTAAMAAELHALPALLTVAETIRLGRSDEGITRAGAEHEARLIASQILAGT